MTAIATLTFSPSLDSATVTERLYPEGKLRCAQPVFEPGGGGINVARAIKRLGGEALAIYPAGGPTGEHLSALLKAEGLQVAVEVTRDWTRQNLHVLAQNSGEQYRFVMPGAALCSEEIHGLRLKVAALPAHTLLVISGSLPPGMDVADLVDVLILAKEKRLHCVVDSSGAALAAAVAEGGLWLIKPNQAELAELTGAAVDTPEAIVAAARSLIKRGAAKLVVVSMGPQGALAVSQEQSLQVVPPPVQKLSTVGAGDSMVGAMCLKLAAGADLQEMARFGVAAGTAATLRHGTQLCDPVETERLFHLIKQR
ncbi:MAG: 6-phosphofructokinase II [Aeromonadaceae bacterium]